jgi:hypothetical protein
MEPNDYNRVNALVYEVILFLQNFFKFFRVNPIIKEILENCRPDWVEFRTRIVLAELDKQVEQIHKAWDLEEAEKQKPIYSEEPADDSEAQRLLGGPMRLSVSWTFDKPEPSSSHEHN